MMEEIYLALFFNTVFILVNGRRLQNRLTKTLSTLLKVLFFFTLSYILYRVSLSDGKTMLSSVVYLAFIFFSLPFVLFIGRKWKVDALMMSSLIMGIYFLFQNKYHGEFVSFLLYMLVNLVLMKKVEAKNLKVIIVNISFYVLAWIFLYVSNYDFQQYLPGSIDMEILFLAFFFFNVVLSQCMGISPFYSHRDDYISVVDKKSIFKIDIIFFLIVFPIHLIMLERIFSILDAEYQDFFIITLVIMFFVSLIREYMKKEDDLTIFVNVKLVMMNIMLLTYLSRDREILETLCYVMIPFVLVHFPFLTKENHQQKNNMLNYLFAFFVLGLGPSTIFKIKTYVLLLLFQYNKYLCFFFIFSTILVVIKFLIFFIKNQKYLVYIKNPVYYFVFLVVLCICLFSGHIPDKI